MRRPPGADPGGPLLLQRRVGVQHQQVRQRDVHPGLDRLPGPLRQQAPGEEAAHRLVHRVVVALGVAAGVLGAGRRGQRVQDRADHGCALGREVAGDDPGALEGGLHPHRPVPEPVVRAVLTGTGLRPGDDLAGQAGQVPQVHPGPRRADQDRIGRVPAVLRELVGPAADLPGVRLRHHVPLGQRLGDLRVRLSPPGPRGVPGRGPFGDPGAVDQPGPGTVVGVGGIALPADEGAQDRGPRCRAHRGDLLEGPQALGLLLGHHRRRVRRGQEPHRGAQHPQRLGRVHGRRDGIHLAHLLRHVADRRVRAGARSWLRSLLPRGQIQDLSRLVRSINKAQALF